MDLTEIEKQARALMTAHGVGDLDFAFDNSKVRLGAMHRRIYDKGTRYEKHIPIKITLSKHYAALLPEDEIRDVILHEIAHALTPGHSHNAVWMSTARRIGAKPQRCARPSVSPEPSVIGMCVPCNAEVFKGHRLPQRVYIHSTCRGALVYFRNGEKVWMDQMPQNYQTRHYQATRSGRI